jgi:hypothetical protein
MSCIAFCIFGDTNQIIESRVLIKTYKLLILDEIMTIVTTRTCL